IRIETGGAPPARSRAPPAPKRRRSSWRTARRASRRSQDTAAMLSSQGSDYPSRCRGDQNVTPSRPLTYDRLPRRRLRFQIGLPDQALCLQARDLRLRIPQHLAVHVVVVLAQAGRRVAEPRRRLRELPEEARVEVGAGLALGEAVEEAARRDLRV